MFPDIGIEDSIMKFSGLDSGSALESYSSELVNDLARKIPGLVKDMGVSLSAFSGISPAVGLGALMISLFLEFVINGLTKTQSEDPMLRVVRHVFAEEKASGVRDSMVEYYKRFSLNMYDAEMLLYDTKRLEEQLSNGLTKLSNSMLYDNQISTRSMKIWTNGAAFHLLMRVHIARMEMAKSPGSENILNGHVLSVSNLAHHYSNDLQSLLTNYKTYKRSNIYTDYTRRHVGPYTGVIIRRHCGVHDKELNKYASPEKFSNSGFADMHCHEMATQYLDYMFNNWNLLKELKEYFSGMKQNLKEKILQHSEFNIQKFIPDSRM